MMGEYKNKNIIAQHNRNKTIDVLKGIAIISILLSHAIIYYPVNLHEISWCQCLFNFVSAYGNRLFFVLSGYCYKSIEMEKHRTYFTKKVKRLVIPYFAYNFLDLIPRALLPMFVNRPRDVGSSLWKILFYGGEYWFLYTLFEIFLIFPFVDLLIKRWVRVAHMIVTGFFVLIFISPYLPELFLINRFAKYLFFFTFGFVLHGKLEAMKEKRSRLIAWLSHLKNSAALSRHSIGVKKYGEKILNMLQSVGTMTLQIYLLNGFLLTPARYTIVALLGRDTNAAIIIGFNMSVTLVGAYIIIQYVIKKFKILRVCSGI